MKSSSNEKVKSLAKKENSSAPIKKTPVVSKVKKSGTIKKASKGKDTSSDSA